VSQASAPRAETYCLRHDRCRSVYQILWISDSCAEIEVGQAGTPGVAYSFRGRAASGAIAVAARSWHADAAIIEDRLAGRRVDVSYAGRRVRQCGTERGRCCRGVAVAWFTNSACWRLPLDSRPGGSAYRHKFLCRLIWVSSHSLTTLDGVASGTNSSACRPPATGARRGRRARLVRRQ